MNPAPSPSFRTVWAAALVLLAAGCGGGGGTSSGAGAAAPAEAPSPAPGAAPSPAPVPQALSTCGQSDFANRLLTRLNQVRSAGATCGATAYPPVSPVTWNDLLARAADAHTQDMAASNYFSHTSQDGRTFSQRITAAGYAWKAAGENIAAGYNGVDAVMNGWIASEGHCRNLMSANFTEVGVACVPGTSASTYSNYWTMDLGRR